MISQNETDYSIDCQGDACRGDVITFLKEIWLSNKCCGTIRLFGRIFEESYSNNGRHEFQIVLHNGAKIDIRGRDLYKYELKRMPWNDESKREEILKEKHLRGEFIRRRNYEKTIRKNDSIRDGRTRQFQQRRAS